jgi:hypothetical protein
VLLVDSAVCVNTWCLRVFSMLLIGNIWNVNGYV